MLTSKKQITTELDSSSSAIGPSTCFRPDFSSASPLVTGFLASPLVTSYSASPLVTSYSASPPVTS